MSAYAFYHLERTGVDAALPALVQKAYEQGHRLHIRLPDEVQVKAMDRLLWTYAPSSFLPHGTDQSAPAPDDQPIWIGCGSDNLNGATILFVVHPDQANGPHEYARCCYIFDGRNADTLDTARAFWKRLKEAGATPVYYQQTEAGWQAKG